MKEEFFEQQRRALEQDGLALPTDGGAVLQQARRMAGMVVEYKELMMMYTCAMKEVRTKFDVLDAEFRARYERNPIKDINTRLKSTSSLVSKLERQGLGFSIENIERHINDVAGVRVVCSYVDDIYLIAEALIRQDDVELITRKDYIENPKPNGYRSLHLIVSVPVFFANQKRRLRVEVQIRTIAMDFWASLEHQLKYKQDIPNGQQIVARLGECAQIIARTDAQMLALRREIDAAAAAPSEDDILLEKLRRLDISIE